MKQRNQLTQLWEQVKFGCRTRLLHVLAVLAAFVGMFFLAWMFADKPLDSREARWTYLDRVFTFATFAIAAMVWLGEIKEDWERRLPRRLFAYFLFDEHPVAICLGANLSDERDARALGQQIGAQMFATKSESGKPEPGQPESSRPESGKPDKPDKQLNFEIDRVECQELPVVSRGVSFKPIRVVFRLTDPKQVELFQSNAEKETALIWTPQSQRDESGRKGERKPWTDPLCQLPWTKPGYDLRTEQLSDEVIAVVI